VITRRKIMVRIALLGLLALASTGLSAAEPPSRAQWVEIGVATDGTRAFVDRSSISETGGRVSLWQRFALGPKNPHRRAARAVEQRVIYDCRTRIVSTLESRELSGGGAVLRRQRFRPPAQDAIGAATLPEYIFEAVC
jgi:hypothetical protein